MVLRNIPGLLTADGWLLLATRCVRMFAYGFLSVELVLYLTAVGLSVERVGLLLGLTLLGDTAVSLWITTSADRLGRKKMLIIAHTVDGFCRRDVRRDDELLVVAVRGHRGCDQSQSARSGPLPVDRAGVAFAHRAEQSAD